MYMMHLLGPHLYHSSQLTHQIFTPLFLFSTGGLIQWACTSQVYFQLHRHNTQTHVMPKLAHAS